VSGEGSRAVAIGLAGGAVSGLLTTGDDPTHLYVLAHGAGAGMRHPFLVAVANRLAHHRIATLRYQFPYMEAGRKRTDSPAVAQAAVRAAVGAAAKACPGVPLLAGGKSFGGRMTSGAQAEAPLEGVRGLAFLGFPMHAPGKPATERAEHLARVTVPMLFLQGTRDDFARLDLLHEVIAGLGSRATLELVDGADHSFHVPKSSGRTDAEVLDRLCETIAGWAGGVRSEE
jgi:predicted alpha/beta-hydrolase family hydrolase